MFSWLLFMKRQLFSFLLIFLFVFNISAQEKETRQVGKLSSYWQCEKVRMVVDSFLIELQNNPQSTGFIIVYEGKYSEQIYDKGKLKTRTYLPRYGEAFYRTQIIRDHIKLRRFSPDRVLFINGGFLQEHEIEFWIVPNGAELPKPNPTLDKIEYRKGKPLWKCDETF